MIKWFKDVLKELREINKTLSRIEAHVTIAKVNTEVICDKVAPLKKDDSMEKVLKEIKHIRKYAREAR